MAGFRAICRQRPITAIVLKCEQIWVASTKSPASTSVFHGIVMAAANQRCSRSLPRPGGSPTQCVGRDALSRSPNASSTCHGQEALSCRASVRGYLLRSAGTVHVLPRMGLCRCCGERFANDRISLGLGIAGREISFRAAKPQL